MSEDTKATHAAARRADYVRALKEEREGYVRAGKTDRVKQVDEQLAAFGQAPKEPKPTVKKTQTRKG